MSIRYINKSGTRWRSSNPEDMKFVFCIDGKPVRFRQASFWEQIGNFACIGYTYKSTKYRCFPRDGESSPIPIIDLERSV